MAIIQRDKSARICIGSVRGLPYLDDEDTATVHARRQLNDKPRVH